MCISNSRDFHYLCEYMNVNCSFAVQRDKTRKKGILKCIIAVGGAPLLHQAFDHTVNRLHNAAAAPA